MTEWMLSDVAAAHPITYGVLRYFNVAGGDPKKRSGQSTPLATHLIKVAAQTALGQRQKMDIFGTDYDTPDGTCIRDYIHVDDLADAHLKALAHLAGGGGSDTFNVGTGVGSSVLEVIRATERISERPVPYEIVARRPGDPVATFADPTRSADVLGWRATRSLDDIIASAWAWHHAHPDGYRDIR